MTDREHRVRVYKWWMGAQDWYRWECSCGAHQRGGSRSLARAERFGRMHSYNVRRPERATAALDVGQFAGPASSAGRRADLTATVPRSRRDKNGRPISRCSSCGDRARTGSLLCRPCARAKQLEPGRTRAP